MDKETLSNYGWIVICVLVLAVMLALATPFGTFIADGFKATYTGLFDTGDSALDVGLNAVGVKNVLDCGHERKETGNHTQKECGHYNCQDTDCGCVPASCGIEGHWSNDGKDHTTKVYHTNSVSYKTPHTYACECNGWIVPEGGTYVNSSIEYTAGDIAPCLKSGDKYMFGDYVYTYQVMGINAYRSPWGWNVAINTDVTDNTKSSYGAILESIREEPIVGLYQTFKNCENLTDEGVPKLPDTVSNMYETFYGCKNLINLNGRALPTGLEFMYETFYRCTSLTSMSAIPSGVTDMTYTFEYCYSLTAPPDMSNAINLEKMYGTFRECQRLVTPPNLSNCKKLTNMCMAFDFCYSLIELPVIPDGVTKLTSAFYYCKSITTAPAIPNSVQDLRSAFSYCFNLTGTVEINADNLTEFSGCFSSTSKNIVLTGDCPQLLEIAATSPNGNVTVQQ